MSSPFFLSHSHYSVMAYYIKLRLHYEVWCRSDVCCRRCRAPIKSPTPAVTQTLSPPICSVIFVTLLLWDISSLSRHFCRCSWLKDAWERFIYSLMWMRLHSGLCWGVGYHQWSQPLSSAAAFPHNAVLCTPGSWVRQAESDTNRRKQKQNLCQGMCPIFNSINLPISIRTCSVLVMSQFGPQPSGRLWIFLDLLPSKSVAFIGVLEYSHLQWVYPSTTGSV